MDVKFVSITPDAEKTMAYIARVSNPSNQDNEKFAGLLKYCIKHNHWSVFEQSSMTLEIETTRAIAAQILRHRSFTFQEFSQRYADSTKLGEIPIPELRRQDEKNRQNSTNDLDEFVKQKLELQMNTLFSSATALYQQMLEEGVAKECARMVLPLCTPTRIYMTGSCRSWIHYIELRSAHGTQKEHMDIAQACKTVFVEQFPIVSEALEWRNGVVEIQKQIKKELHGEET
jgi:thymidylate synthase (FAD)|tara:strand:- start:3 stop:692 length:690 start_codon:yes stop_codon:yes gene_type:complete